MRASKAEQMALLELQQLDTRLAQLTASRKKHPAFQTLTELSGRKADLERAAAGAASRYTDVKRELSVYENDMKRLTERQNVMTQRLNSGEGSHKDLVVIQNELNQMAKRREKLETQILQVMTRLEAAQADIDAIKNNVQALAAQAQEARSEYQSAMGAVDAEYTAKKARREELSNSLDSEILDEFTHCQNRSGLGVVAAVGRQLVGMQNALSEYEWHQINALGKEEIFYSEDMECLIVKLTEEELAKLK